MPFVTNSALPLPDTLRSLFWEYNFSLLRWSTHDALIIHRILHLGTLDHMFWLTDTIGYEPVRKYILTTNGKGLSPKVLRYWETVLDLPHDQVTSWIESFNNTLWGQR